ncbi:MAG: hypothetical protein NC548_32295 [Lachnospiraceae bacterium]|nr:hypothetical protein [Lachnospiraceae bacterium]
MRAYAQSKGVDVAGMSVHELCLAVDAVTFLDIEDVRTILNEVRESV